MRPRIGEVVNLVYRECPCGWWCATGEGSTAPICPNCGGHAVPLGTSFGQDGDVEGDQLGRRARSLGFTALFTAEISGLEGLGKIRKLLGLSQARATHGREEPSPYALPGEAEWANFRIRGGFLTCESLEDVYAAMRLLMRYGPGPRRPLHLSEDEIVVLWDLVGSGKPQICTPFDVVTPFGDLEVHRYGPDGPVVRCTCADRPLPADADHEDSCDRA